MSTKDNARTDYAVPRYPDGRPIEARAVYPFLDKKRDRDFANTPLPEDEQYYEVILIFPKAGATPQTDPVYLALSNIIGGLVPTFFRGQWPQGANWPIVDGDTKAAKYPWAAGHWYLRSWSDFPIPVQQPLPGGGFGPAPKDAAGKFTSFKSGDYVVASLGGYAYTKGEQGININVEMLVKTRDGDRIGSGVRAVESVFNPSDLAAAASTYAAATDAATLQAINGASSQMAPALPPGYAPQGVPPGYPPQQAPAP